MTTNSSSFKVKAYNEIIRIDWDNFVNKCNTGWLWHLSSFIEAKSKWQNHINRSFAIVDSNSNIVGIFPLFQIINKRFKVINISILDNIGGWLSLPTHKLKRNIDNLLLSKCKAISTQYACHTININFSTASLHHKYSPIYLSGLEGKLAYTSVIDLNKTEQDLWSNMSKGHRYSLKQAKKNGVTFREATTNDLDLYYDMHKQTYSKSSIAPHNIGYFESIFGEILKNKNAYIGCAIYKDKIIAMVNYGIYKNIAIYWAGACFDEAYKIGANHFLHWIMLKEMKKKNIQYLEMGEVFVEHKSTKIQGISNFKSNFGGKLSSCFKAEIKNSSLLLDIYKCLKRV